jgi:cell division protein FtsW
VPLPLFSYGGSSLVVTLGALGVLINVSRSAPQPEARVRRAPRMESGDD